MAAFDPELPANQDFLAGPNSQHLADVHTDNANFQMTTLAFDHNHGRFRLLMVGRVDSYRFVRTNANRHRVILRDVAQRINSDIGNQITDVIDLRDRSFNGVTQ